ncbi:MAG TPA: nuclear transport factor 2 family protein [Anaerolineales bacterium]|nr:nuclear transport factor 2 family protein [Anaerolineales bacterium]
MTAMDIVKEGLMAADSGNFGKLAELLADDMVFAGPVPEPVGKREFLAIQSAMQAGMPDWKFNATDFKEDGDKVTVTLQITGTQTAELKLPMPGMAPIPATGKRISLPKEPTTFTVKNGKVTRLESAAVPGGGVMGVLAQLGVPLPK